MPDGQPGSPDAPPPSGWPARTASIRRAAARLCLAMDWSPLHEVALPNGRRADILALRPDGGFVCVEVKSGARDFLSDAKWREYRAFCDALMFAVDADFPRRLLPDDVGLAVVCNGVADLVRAPPSHPLPAARRRALLLRFARLAAMRVVAAEDPAGVAELRAALLVE